MTLKKIPFSPPDITQEEIEAVSEVLRSGWIRRGPTVRNLSKKLRITAHSAAVALNSATAGLELILKVGYRRQ
jgi:dTDP-4-amino-4,6-dideoxygalactose transaminase